MSLAGLRGRWVVVFFYPADFSFVCPTEVRGFAAAYADFVAEEAEVVGVSPDAVEVHRAWSSELGGLPYPLCTDAGNAAALAWGATADSAERPERATYIVDPEGMLLFVMRVSRNVGRGVAETLRVLRALRTGRLCPVDWSPGDPTYDVDLEAAGEGDEAVTPSARAAAPRAIIGRRSPDTGGEG